MQIAAVVKPDQTSNLIRFSYKITRPPLSQPDCHIKIHLEFENCGVKMLKVENFIDGQFEATKDYLDSYEPGTGQVWAQIPDSDDQDVDKAVQAAKKAFKSWKKLSVNQRAQYLIKAADLLESRLDEFALAESR